MTRSRLVRRLGLDGNPLRRRTDKIAAWSRPVLVDFIQRTEGLALCGRGTVCPR
jgi:hypothetical protein